jgi:hypothetical protein
MRATAPTIAHETIEWKIKVARNVIAYSWAELAISGLSSEQRNAIRERLQINLKTLRHLLNEQRQASEAHSLGVNAVESALRF